MSVVVFSAVAGLVAARAPIDLTTALIAIFCIALGGGGSAALNMWYEADSDAKMARTSGRVLPSGQLKPREVLFLGVAASVAAVAVMASLVNVPAAIVLAATIFAYAILYTVAMKRRTVLSVPVGGALAGILTPLTGWTAATGSIDVTALILFAYVFFWTPPHVWSQAAYQMTDYRRAGVPMLPAAHGLPATRYWILVFTALHVVVAELPWFTGDAGLLYLTVSCLAGGCLLWKTVKLYRCTTDVDTFREAREYFRLSIYYVVTLLSVVCIDRVLLMP